MAGAWVNENKYSPDKRHFIPEGVTRRHVRTTDRGEYRYVYFLDEANGPTLCGSTQYGSNYRVRAEGYTCYGSDGEPRHKMGGLSVKEKVNLLQSNLCSYCRKAYIAERPALKEAVEAVQKAQVLSE